MKNDRRIYYYNILKKTEPDYENMAAYLLDKDVLFVSSPVVKLAIEVVSN